VGLQPRQRTMVVWSSSAGRAGRHGARQMSRPVRAGRIRRSLRISVLLTIIGLMRLGRIARKYPRPALSLAGTAVTVAGVSLPSGVVLVSGILVLLVALFLPHPASAPARPCSCRLWAMPLTPFTLPGRDAPPSN
jgi:hypothetical protein